MKRTKTTAFRKLSIYGFELVQGGHNFYALLEFDVTELRAVLRSKRREGNGGSLFAFMLKAIGKCLEEFPEFNAMIDLRRTTSFEEVDVNIPIEVEHEGKLNPKQHIVRNINAKSLTEVDAEIFAAKRSDEGHGYVASPGLMKLFAALPRFLFRLAFRVILKHHRLVKDLSGTVFVTSVSMFSNIPGFIVPYVGGPKAVSFALGSAVKKPVVVAGTAITGAAAAGADVVAVREMMNVTAAFNHDLVDGAPAARFINRLRKYVERDYESLM